MKIERSIFRSKVAQRIFMLFIISALVPVAISTWLSFRYARNVFAEKDITQLRQDSKNYGIQVFEKLKFVDAVLGNIASDIQTDDPENFKSMEHMAKAITFINADNTNQHIKNYIVALPKLNSEIFENFIYNKRLLFTYPGPGNNPRVFMAAAVNKKNLLGGLLVVEIQPRYLWGDQENFPLQTDFCVLDHTQQMQFCSYPKPAQVKEQLLTAQANSSFKWTFGDTEYHAFNRELFLQAEFSSPPWQIIAIRPDAHTAISNFAAVLIPVSILSLLVVALLSIYHIRRTLKPLESLTQGAHRIINRELKEKIIMNSGDEFEALANTLNAIMKSLDRQFSMLSILAKIDRAILTSPDLNQIQSMVLNYVNEIIPCDIACIALIDSETHHIGDNHILISNSHEFFREKNRLTDVEIRSLINHPDGFQMDFAFSQNTDLSLLKNFGAKSSYLVPIIMENRLGGIIHIGYWDAINLRDDDIRLAHELADRLAVTLSTILYNKTTFEKSYPNETTSPANQQSAIAATTAVINTQQEPSSQPQETVNDCEPAMLRKTNNIT